MHTITITYSAHYSSAFVVSVVIIVCVISELIIRGSPVVYLVSVRIVFCW